MAGHHHNPYAAYIHRQFYAVSRAALFQGKRTEETHYRVEAPVLHVFHIDAFVTAYAERSGHLGVEGADHFVVEVPGLHPEGLLGVHRSPRVRRFERSDVQQALIDYGYGVAHRPSRGLAHFELELLLRPYDLRSIDDRLQPRILVVHAYGLDAVHPQRRVIFPFRIWLQQTDAYIEIRRHLSAHLYRVSGLFLSCLHPAAGQYAPAVLYAHQRPAVLSRRNEECQILACLAAVAVCGYAQQARGIRILPVGASPPLRPVHRHLAAAGVPAVQVFYIYEISAPVGVVEAPLEHGLSAFRLQHSSGHAVRRVSVDIGGISSLVVLQPPVPIHFVYAVFQTVTVYASSFGVEDHQAEFVVPVRLQAVPVGLRQFQSHVCPVR